MSKREIKRLRDEVDHLHARINDLKDLTLNLAALIGGIKDTNALVMWPSIYEAVPGLKDIVNTRMKQVMDKDAELRKEAKDQENKEILENMEKLSDKSSVV